MHSQITTLLTWFLGICSAFAWMAAFSQSPGSVDASFGQAGWTRLDLAEQEEVLQLGWKGNGWVALSSYQDSVHTGYRLVGLSPGGQLDPSFGTQGGLELDSAGLLGFHAVDLLTLANGDIMVLAGGLDPLSNKRVLAFMQFNPSGAPDSTFGNSGVQWVAFAGLHGDPKGMVLQPDGKIVYVGLGTDTVMAFQRHPLVGRILPTGRVDSSFGGTGKMILNYQLGLVDVRGPHGSSGAFDDVAVFPDGSILCAGSAASLANSKASLVMFLPNGELDTTFYGTGIYLWDINPGYGSAMHQVHALDGKDMALLPDFDPGLFAADFYVQTSLSGAPLQFPTGHGQLGLTEYAWAMTPDLGGHLVVCGSSRDLASVDSADRFTLMRVQTASTALDSTWGSGGWFRALPPGSTWATARALSVAPDGKILAGGHMRSQNPAEQDLVFTRLLAGIPLGGNTWQEPGKIMVFPSPASDHLTVKGHVRGVSWKLLDLQGRTVASGSLSVGETDIPVANCPRGLYLLLMTQGGQNSIQRVVLN